MKIFKTLFLAGAGWAMGCHCGNFLSETIREISRKCISKIPEDFRREHIPASVDFEETNNVVGFCRFEN